MGGEEVRESCSVGLVSRGTWTMVRGVDRIGVEGNVFKECNIHGDELLSKGRIIT